MRRIMVILILLLIPIIGFAQNYEQAVVSTSPQAGTIWNVSIASFSCILVSVKVTSASAESSSSDQRLELFDQDVSTDNAPRLTPIIDGHHPEGYEFSNGYYIHVATAGIRYNKIGNFQVQIQVVPNGAIPYGRTFFP